MSHPNSSIPISDKSQQVCFYFQVHQPWRLRPYRFYEIGKSSHYFDDQLNEDVLRRVTDRCYLPMNRLLLKLIRAHQGRFKVAFSISGAALDQLEQYAPKAIESFRELFETGCVELLSETHYHSLASLLSRSEFQEQIEIHRETAQRLLGVRPSRVFRNTELITSATIARQVKEFGYQGLMIEGVEWVLRDGTPHELYKIAGSRGLIGLPRDYFLSDEIAFRFRDADGPGMNLSARRFAGKVREAGAGFTGIYLDYETFGEHLDQGTGIFRFMEEMPSLLLESGQIAFVTPTDAISPWISQVPSLAELEIPRPFSWADSEKDLSAWIGNPIQNAALEAVWRLEKSVAPRWRETWRKLLTSDHFYYMCTKRLGDGEVHKYFSPHGSPYDAHIAFMNVVEDLALRLGGYPVQAQVP